MHTAQPKVLRKSSQKTNAITFSMVCQYTKTIYAQGDHTTSRRTSISHSLDSSIQYLDTATKSLQTYHHRATTNKSTKLQGNSLFTVNPPALAKEVHVKRCTGAKKQGQSDCRVGVWVACVVCSSSTGFVKHHFSWELTKNTTRKF